MKWKAPTYLETQQELVHREMEAEVTLSTDNVIPKHWLDTHTILMDEYRDAYDAELKHIKVNFPEYFEITLDICRALNKCCRKAGLISHFLNGIRQRKYRRAYAYLKQQKSYSPDKLDMLKRVLRTKDYL